MALEIQLRCWWDSVHLPAHQREYWAIPKVQLLVIHGSQDATIPADVCIDYAGALDGNHSFDFLNSKANGQKNKNYNFF